MPMGPIVELHNLVKFTTAARAAGNPPAQEITHRLMQAQEQRVFPTQRGKRNSKHKLQSDVVRAMTSLGIKGWKPATLPDGTRFLTLLVDILWHLDSKHKQLRKTGNPMPDFFAEFHDYNDYKSKKQSKPTLIYALISDFAMQLGMHLERPWMLVPHFAPLLDPLTSLHAVLVNMSTILSSQNQRSSTNHSNAHPVRSFGDNIAIQSFPGCSSLQTVSRGTYRVSDWKRLVDKGCMTGCCGGTKKLALDLGAMQVLNCPTTQAYIAIPHAHRFSNMCLQTLMPRITHHDHASSRISFCHFPMKC